MASLVATRLATALALPCGSAGYWAVSAAVVPPLAAALLLARRHVLWKAAVVARAVAAAAAASGAPAEDPEACRKQPPVPPEHSPPWLSPLTAGRLAWTPANSLALPAFCVAAGLLAGLLGLGGGIVLTPLMLELRVHPQVTVASSQVTLMLSSAAAAIIYASQGIIRWDYGIALAATCFVATLLGQVAIDAAVRRTGRPGLLVLLLAAMCVLGTAASVYVAGAALARVARRPELVGAVGSVCGVS
ncbi:hypothetical protein MNEG_5983 [Monoraphidium neglectum]|uniref:Uncharacterized protein n=1 Tax=Monoraphidium neglectum TaxID=145388 RepID=A0A0D2N870_9CHLO|nr:hypothetical protein MNEG_5983 [Monoraphidium neglectum]KIZ01981.1 hypothetical protein MNEG_5983 [Monoraphidium neglectum]|eukprot:XP_013901000.1 hypothetical protein MNEG_5983 [Monoraphidium neglectum]